MGEAMKKILVVVDMQNDFIDGSLGTIEAIGIVDAAADRIKKFEGKIYATLDTHFDNYLDTAEGKKLPVRHCIKGTKGWQLNGKIKTALEGKECVRVEKNTFGSTKLALYVGEDIKECRFADKDISIELIGLCTDICVVSNALLLKAFYPEVNITVDARCCAGVTPAAHEAAIATMKSCQIDVQEF